jgi:phospholipase/carboxylesterase
MTTRLPGIEINPQTSAVGSVIWLHGLGADGGDFAPLVPELQLPEHLPVRFIFPHAPKIPVTINNRYVMPAWYDILSLAVERHADTAGIDESAKKIHALIEHEKERGIPANKIILAGFSQGAVMALTAGLTYPERLGGIIALSGYLPYHDEVLQKTPLANQSIPIFLAHGTNDTVVPYSLGEIVLHLLQKNHYSVDWHAYQMAHSVCADEIRDIAHFIERVI